MQGSPVQFHFEDVSPVEKRLKIEVAREHVSQKLDDAYRKLSKEVNLRGFRKGKAPRSYLEKLFARKVENDVRNELINETLMYVAQQSSLSLLDQPSIEQISELRKDQSLQFSARFEVMPTVSASNYDGLEIDQRAPKITDEQVEEALQRRRRDHMELLPIEEGSRDTVERTDVVTVLLSGRAGNQTLNNREFQVDMSDPGSAQAGLVEALLGLSFQTKDHPISLPQDEGRQFALKATIKAVHLKQLPGLDDDFAKDTGEAETLDELRNKVRADLEKHEAGLVKQEVRDKILDELIRLNPVPAPAGWVERTVQNILKHNQGFLYQEVIRRGGASGEMNDAKMREIAKEAAEKSLASDLLLTSIADSEKLEVTDADLELRLAELARQQDKSTTRLRAELQREDSGLTRLRESMRVEKALDLLESRAKIKVNE